MSLLEKPQSYVYFIESGEDGPIKVGHSADVPRRLSTLQTASPTLLTLLLAVPGGREEEARVHNLFAHERMSGEWFRGDGSLRGFVRHLSRLSEVDAIQKMADEPSISELTCWADRQEEARLEYNALCRIVVEEYGAQGAEMIQRAARR